NLSIWRNSSNFIPTTKSYDSFGNIIGPLGNPTGTLLIAPFDQDFELTLLLYPEGNIGHTDKICIKLNDLTNNTSQTKYYQFDYPTLENYYTANYLFSALEGHNYKIEVYFSSTTSSTSSVPVKVEAVLKTKEIVVIDDFGVRVKTVKDYSDSNALPTIKRYYYHSKENYYVD